MITSPLFMVGVCMKGAKDADARMRLLVVSVVCYIKVGEFQRA